MGSMHLISSFPQIVRIFIVSIYGEMPTLCKLCAASSTQARTQKTAGDQKALTGCHLQAVSGTERPAFPVFEVEPIPAVSISPFPAENPI